jgi:hypothetical protein
VKRCTDVDIPQLHSPFCSMFMRFEKLATRPMLESRSPADLRRGSAGPKTLGGYFTRLLDRLHKLQQVGVDLICMRSGKAVRRARIKKLLGSLDELG